ncbi:PASTA domain-containing protein [Streptomyces sp. ISL-12]|uniref:PASTA domain-containing protein n=1 Tax=Streptomyces sp. ISL-12 TaxID=2819177 RepID=UPI001BEB2E08|nr:PASTA domain-containing protein [Streptomyces sp. ISL-12]MBT2409785.1 PASTA domain-containing protein [Streptomyces sp. ISL-12]
MAVDARRAAEARGVLLAAPDRPELHRVVVEYVVRQYPPPGAEVPRGAAVTVWFDFGAGEGGGGAGVREPRTPAPPGGGLRRALDEPGTPDAARDGAGAAAGTAGAARVSGAEGAPVAVPYAVLGG